MKYLREATNLSCLKLNSFCLPSYIRILYRNRTNRISLSLSYISIHFLISVSIHQAISVDTYHCSVTQSSLTLQNPMGCSKPGYLVLHYLLEFTQNHVHWVNNAIQPSHPLSYPSPPALNLPQHQDLFSWVSSLHQVAKVLACQLQPHSFQWIFREYSIRIDWFEFLAVQGTLKSLLQHHSSKASFLRCSTFFMVQF